MLETTNGVTSDTTGIHETRILSRKWREIGPECNMGSFTRPSDERETTKTEIPQGTMKHNTRRIMKEKEKQGRKNKRHRPRKEKQPIVARKPPREKQESYHKQPEDNKKERGHEKKDHRKCEERKKNLRHCAVQRRLQAIKKCKDDIH